MTAPVNTRPDLVQIRRHETTQSSFDLPGPDPSAPPPTTAECPAERPCPRLRCRNHLWANDERPGRPVAGKRPNKTVTHRDESCVRDVVAKNPDGLSNRRIGKLLGVDIRRVEQLIARGTLKREIGEVLLDAEDHIRERLPPGTNVGAVLHPGGDDPATVLVTFVVVVDKPNAVRTTSVDVARKREKPVPGALRERREELGLMLSDVARDVGVSIQQLAEYERGATACPPTVKTKLGELYAQADGQRAGVAIRKRGT